eukprot:GHVR01053643.1.p1 GENE.GHVR01053643.1~~GHVR01053643.1.p1  ORF type:complete len:231 (+),score=88.41 GHVR01053643.1:185-877(+)
MSIFSRNNLILGVLNKVKVNESITTRGRVTQGRSLTYLNIPYQSNIRYIYGRYNILKPSSYYHNVFLSNFRYFNSQNIYNKNISGNITLGRYISKFLWVISVGGVVVVSVGACTVTYLMNTIPSFKLKINSLFPDESLFLSTHVSPVLFYITSLRNSFGKETDSLHTHTHTHKYTHIDTDTDTHANIPDEYLKVSHIDTSAITHTHTHTHTHTQREYIKKSENKQYIYNK